MSVLAWILIFKTAVTLLFVALPFFFLSADTLSQLLAAPVSVAMARLYAMAVLALLVGYGFGLAENLQGRLPTGTLWMGLVSNAGATALILVHLSGGLRIVGALTFGAVATGLALVLLSPNCLAGVGAC